MTSETIRWLVDAADGGPPRAFECKLADGKPSGKACGAVTRTLRGMRSHQRSVHGFRAQKALFEVPVKQAKERWRMK